MQPGWCLICGSTRSQDFAKKESDRVTSRLYGEVRSFLRFVMCEDCGHVYQDPMLDASDLERLYTDGYRPLLESADDIVKEMERGRGVSERVADLVEPTVRRRTVLDIGCGSGTYLRPFKERGWKVFGIDPVPAWTDFARRELGGTRESIVAGHYGPGAFPGRKFSLILFSHTVEHIPDPLPLLRLMRSHLEEDGVLFVAAPNLLNPPRGNLFGGFLAGAHVRLYSPGALKTVLARSGFRSDADLNVPEGFGMGLVARPGEGAPDQPHDDALAIRQLYAGLHHEESADVLGRNLAALAKTQPWTLPILCQRLDATGYRVERNGKRLRSVIGRKAEGGEVAIVTSDERGGSQGAYGRPDDGQTAVMVQLGLGSADRVRAAAEGVTGDDHLFIWEVDPVVAKIVLKVADLGSVWSSPNVTLLLGLRPLIPPALRARLAAVTHLHLTESAQRWKTGAYRNIAKLLGRDMPASCGAGVVRVPDGPMAARR